LDTCITLCNADSDYQGHIQTLHVPWEITTIPGRNLVVITSHAQTAFNLYTYLARKL